MKGTVYDIAANGGVSKHISALSSHQHATSNGAVHAQAEVVSNLPFITLLTALIAITYLRPQILCAREFYKNCFKNKCWWHPPRRWVFDVLWFLADAFMVVAMTHYLYLQRNPASGTDTNYYLAIYSLFIFYLGSRYFWINSFWNYHSKKSLVDANGEKEMVSYTSEPAIALSFAVFWALMMVLAVTALVVLFGIRADWWAFGFALAVWIWLIFILIWTAIVRSCLGCEKVCVSRPACALNARSNKGNGLF